MQGVFFASAVLRRGASVVAESGEREVGESGARGGSVFADERARLLDDGTTAVCDLAHPAENERELMRSESKARGQRGIRDRRSRDSM